MLTDKIAVYPVYLKYNFVDWYDNPVPEGMLSRDANKFTDAEPFVFNRRPGEKDMRWAARLRAETEAEVEGRRGPAYFTAKGAARLDAADFLEGKDWIEELDYRLMMLLSFADALDRGEVDL